MDPVSDILGILFYSAFEDIFLNKNAVNSNE